MRIKELTIILYMYMFSIINILFGHDFNAQEEAPNENIEKIQIDSKNAVGKFKGKELKAGDVGKFKTKKTQRGANIV